jgi:hypothetical protein
MEITLIEHNNELYLVSDEEIKEGFILENYPKGLNVSVCRNGVYFHNPEFYNTENKIHSCGHRMILASDNNYLGIHKGLIIPPNLMEVFKGDNKDKRFTESDLRLAFYSNKDTFEQYFESLSTPKEWKVEIEREDCEFCGGDGIYVDGDNNTSKCTMCEKGKSDELKLTKNFEGKECYTITKII